MIREPLMKSAAAVVLGGAALITLLTGCAGGPADASAGAGAKAPAQPTLAAPVPRSAASSPQAGSPSTSSALLVLGKKVFEETAGGVGCAYCHGRDGKGTGPAGVQAAFIQGRKEVDVRYAMANLPMMSIVKLNDQEVDAVVAYLQTLAEQYP